MPIIRWSKMFAGTVLGLILMLVMHEYSLRIYRLGRAAYIDERTRFFDKYYSSPPSPTESDFFNCLLTIALVLCLYELLQKAFMKVAGRPATSTRPER